MLKTHSSFPPVPCASSTLARYSPTALYLPCSGIQQKSFALACTIEQTARLPLTMCLTSVSVPSDHVLHLGERYRMIVPPTIILLNKTPERAGNTPFVPNLERYLGQSTRPLESLCTHFRPIVAHWRGTPPQIIQTTASPDRGMGALRDAISRMFNAPSEYLRGFQMPAN
ncbi:hypothetical protein BC835DRAFT_510095 [Cytidiella melzeri]|nr:hypothetical protein BC835DRAFT_510095 [Cytidiella melzeri]